LNDDNLDELLKTASDSKISIAPADIMKKDFAFKVAVSVEDFGGTKSTEKVLDVYRSSSPLPIIFIDSDTEIFVEHDKGIFLKGKAEFSSCVEPSEIEFSWALGQDGNDLTVLGSDAIPGSDGEASDQYELGGRVINVRPNVLVPGQTYTFELTGAPIGEPANAASASVVVHVLRPALTADIGGGSREVSSLREVVIDGSKSKDPSDVSSLAYEWSCFSRDLDDVCRDATTNEVLTFGDVPRISLAEGSLAEGEYDLTLQVTDYTEQEDGNIVVGSRFAGAAVSLKMIELPIPDVSISANTAAMVVSKSGQINANSKIALTGIANNVAKASDTVRIEGVWEVSGVDGLDLTDVEVAPLGINSPEFVINGNQIPAGSNVNFVYRTSVFTTLVSGEEDMVSASARFSLSVNLPPSSGSCEVYPAEGFALETDFSISCNGWKDEANSAIRYEFIAVTDAGEIILQSTATNAYELPAFSMPSPQEGESSYTATIIAVISDEAGAVVRLGESSITVGNPYAGKTEDEVATALAAQVDGKVVQSLQKGDSSVALATINNVATASPYKDRRRKRRLENNGEDSSSLGLALLENLEAAANAMVITSDNMVEVVQALSKVTELKVDFSTVQVQSIFDLELAFSARVAGDSMSSSTAEMFVKALSDILEPEFVGVVIERDFGMLSDSGRIEIKAFTSHLTQTFESIKLNIGNALLKNQVNGEMSVKIGKDRGVSMSVQKQSKDNIAKTVMEFTGAEFKLPDDILDAIGEVDGVHILVGYTGIVLSPGETPQADSTVDESFALVESSTTPNADVVLIDSISTQEFGRGVHSLSLGKADGSGLHTVEDLTTPVSIVFEATLPKLDAQCVSWDADDQCLETLTRTVQCVYLDTSGGSWSSTGCEVVSYDETYIECACNHLTDFAHVFTDEQNSFDVVLPETPGPTGTPNTNDDGDASDAPTPFPTNYLEEEEEGSGASTRAVSLFVGGVCVALALVM
jgi:hypothetical protein